MESDHFSNSFINTVSEMSPKNNQLILLLYQNL